MADSRRSKRSFNISRSRCVKDHLAKREIGWFHIGPPLTTTPYYAAFPRYCTSILKHMLANLGGPRPTLWPLEALPLKGFGHPPNTWFTVAHLQFMTAHFGFHYTLKMPWFFCSRCHPGPAIRKSGRARAPPVSNGAGASACVRNYEPWKQLSIKSKRRNKYTLAVASP